MNPRNCISCFAMFLGGWLLATAAGQQPTALSTIPERVATGNRIVSRQAKSPFRERETAQVEVFDPQRALAERQQLMFAEQDQSVVPAVQLVNTTQPVFAPPPPPNVLQSPAVLGTAYDCEPAARVPARQWRRLHLQEQCDAARDMHAHQAYVAPHGGSYYFRPYMVDHIGRQAGIVGNWGGDRRNPCDNRFLQALYPPRANNQR